MSRDGDHSKDTVKTSEHPRASLKPPRRGAGGGGFFVQICVLVRLSDSWLRDLRAGEVLRIWLTEYQLL